MVTTTKTFTVTYDPEADAAYIYFVEPTGLERLDTVPVDPTAIDGMINLDFDDGRLFGIEVVGASQKLPPQMLTP